MDFTQAFKEVDRLKEEFDSIKVNTEFEKSKLKYILGDHLYNTFKACNAMIAGGTISSLFTNKEINDIDVYFRNENDLAAFIMEICESEWIVSSTSKATLFHYKIQQDGEDPLPVQLIHFKYFNNPKEVFDSFDFTVCMGAFDFQTDEFVLHSDFLKHNAQKILKFNQHTDFPLISMIRTNKYQDKGYSISKPEIFKILLASMNLEINSYEELEDQLAGMYGEAYDELLADIDRDAAVDLPMVIERIGNIHLTKNYFKRIDPIHAKYSSIEELIFSITGKKQKYFSGYKGSKFIVDFDNKGFEDAGYSFEPNNEKHEEVEASQYIDDKYYKFVRKKDDRYFSFFDDNFEYIQGDRVEAKHHNGLYFNSFEDIKHSSYYNEDNKVLIEVQVDPKETISGGTTKQFYSCKMIREVPEKEWNKEKQTEQEDCDEGFLDLD